jgi:hypothetical protein
MSNKLKLKRLKEGCTVSIELNPFVHMMLRDQALQMLSKLEDAPVTLETISNDNSFLTFEEAQLKLYLALIKEIEVVAEREEKLEDYEFEFEIEGEQPTSDPSES